MLTELTLFPVNSVLYPNGLMTIKVIKPCDLLMVSDCTRHEKPFVVVSRIDQTENINSTPFNDIGTLAYMVDFDMPRSGILEMRCRGRAMVNIRRYKTRTDSLIIAQIESLPAIETFKLPKKYQVLQEVLRSYIAREGMSRYKEELEEDWDNPDWLGCRLSEILPVDRQQHYKLLIMEPLERLFQIKKLLKK
ncbi:MAG: LON peptidase substrate-binding domain-containing protein [Cocleimonas sp.]|nr:LON peptidase substrate-binding domain-containing protein [Cocleimonas sp.]